VRGRSLEIGHVATAEQLIFFSLWLYMDAFNIGRAVTQILTSAKRSECQISAGPNNGDEIGNRVVDQGEASRNGRPHLAGPKSMLSQETADEAGPHRQHRGILVLSGMNEGIYEEIAREIAERVDRDLFAGAG